MASDRAPIVSINLYDTSRQDVAEIARVHSLPHLRAFIESIEHAQHQGRCNLRNYVAGLIECGYFEIVCPETGVTVRSGSSLLFVDKAVAYSFPSQPELIIGTGDLGLGYPICAALLPMRGLLLMVIRSDWGFGLAHAARFSELAARSGWTPGPATAPFRLVVGDSNFAHHSWNQLSALESIAATMPADRQAEMICTFQPLGPVQHIFPELRHWTSLVRHDHELEGLNERGALFVVPGGSLLTRTLRDRLILLARANLSQNGRVLEGALAACPGPVLWASIRTRNRTATNQQEMLVALAIAFLQAAPDGGLVLDGHSLSADLTDQLQVHQDQARDIAERDLGLANEIKAQITTALGPIAASRVHVAVGLGIQESIVLACQADIYYCHQGTVQHKIGWFTDCPGVIHSNRGFLQLNPSAWIAAQSEIAVPPLYLEPDMVEDAKPEPSAMTTQATLLKHDNYTIFSIPDMIAFLFRHARDSAVPIKEGPIIAKRIKRWHFWKRLGPC